MPYDRTFRVGVPVMLGWLCFSVAGYSQDAQAPQDQSVADAARQARAAKKNTSAKPAKVISDDDIPTKAVEPGAQGLNVGAAPKSDSVPPPAAAVAAVEAADAANAAAESNPPVKAGESPEVSKAKEEVAEIKKALDLLQRGLALDQDSYYSKPDYTSDKSGKGKLDSEQQRINERQQELDEAKAHLAELQKAFGPSKHAGAEGPPASEKPAEAPVPTPPQP